MRLLLCIVVIVVTLALGYLFGAYMPFPWSTIPSLLVGVLGGLAGSYVLGWRS